jgi:hypothetical protein
VRLHAGYSVYLVVAVELGRTCIHLDPNNRRKKSIQTIEQQSINNTENNVIT